MALPPCWNRATLLEGLAASVLVATKLSAVALDDCAIVVAADATDEEPRAGAPSAPLRGLTTLAALAERLGAAPSHNVFVHVVLPAMASNGGGGDELAAVLARLHAHDVKADALGTALQLVAHASTHAITARTQRLLEGGALFYVTDWVGRRSFAASSSPSSSR